MKKNYIQTGIRIEDDLYQELKHMAHDNWRSLSSQINMSLRESLKRGKIDELREMLKTLLSQQSQLLKHYQDTVKKP